MAYASSLASSAKLDIVKVDKGRIRDKLGAMCLFSWNETQTSQTKTVMETRWDNYMANYMHGVFLFSKERAFWTNS